MAKLAQLTKRLGADANRVQVLFITVDPEHDTPAQLAKFVPQFDPAFIGLTGTNKEIADVAHEYRVFYAKHPPSQPNQILVDHATGILIKDAKGKVRLLIKNEIPLDDLEHDVRLLLGRN